MRRRQLSMLAIGLLFGFGTASVSFAATNVDVTTQELNKQNIKTLRVVPIRQERVSEDLLLQEEIVPNESGEYILRRQTIIGLEPIGFLSRNDSNDIVQLSGRTEPYAFVTLIMRSETSPRMEVTRANRRGKWEMSISVDFLAPGEHVAYVQTEIDGVQSSELEVARFVVVARDAVSNTTWIFLTLITLAIVLLLLASTLQIHNVRKALDEQSPEPARKPPSH